MLLTSLANAAAIFTPDSQPTGWISRPVVTLFDVSSGTQSFYQIDYRKNTGAGNVLAFDVSSVARVQPTGPWDNLDPTLTTAASKLSNAHYSTDRKIATLGVPFRWDRMTATERTALGSEQILNFIRGDRSNEEPNGLAFYQRESVLGNIRHSNIYYWDDGTSQSLYVGSNDGMLHSFDANTGEENFAYIPSMLIPKLRKLADKPFVQTHFVDGPISIAKMSISGTTKTFLAGGLGAGGAGLYLLDITTPAAADETAVVNKIKWEITATGSYANLGHTYGTPLFTKLSDGTAVVIIGNGYMNTGNGHAVLFIINVLTGELIDEIDTGSGSAASPNGLSSPTLFDVDGDAVPEYVYAGDIDGNLWKFDLSDNTSSLVYRTSPVQAITTAPVVQAHPLGGQMVDFATGRILTSGDEEDVSVHYAYGVWDGSPGNTQFLTQTYTTSTFGSGGVRTVSDNLPNWSSGHHKGWKIALQPGERVVGERPFYNNGRFYFLSTNPTIGDGENWLNELVFHTGGRPAKVIFDLNQDGSFDNSDLAVNGGIPVAKYLGSGVFSQPLLVKADGLSTTLYAFHPDLPISDGTPTPPLDPGVSGGHFDYDIYYYGAFTTTKVKVPTEEPGDSLNTLLCKKPADIAKELDKWDSGKCKENGAIPPLSDDYSYLVDYSVGAVCAAAAKPEDVKYWNTLTCSKWKEVEITSADYLKKKHVHEYDDKYDVTGVDMLNASILDFNLPKAITDPTTRFKILVMNQYLNPAAKLSVGGANYKNVKTYGNLASETSAETLLRNLPIYTLADIGTFIFNLPLDAFTSKDWWGDQGDIRAGLIPTQTGCVNHVDTDGVQETPGPNNERFNGALTFQLIKYNTPHWRLERNGPDVRYGWRVQMNHFKEYVLAEYTTFWHHPNGECYGDPGWVPDPPQDFDFKAGSEDKVPLSTDPTDGIFGFGLTYYDVTTADGSTFVRTYSNGLTYTSTSTLNNDGSTTTRSWYSNDPDNVEEVINYTGTGGAAGFIDPNTGSPEEELSTGTIGRQTWRDLIDN